MGKMSRDKGAKGEREVAELLRAVFPQASRRSTGEECQEAQGRDLKGTPGLCVQVQLSGAPTIERKLNEAQMGAANGEVPVAFTRRSSVKVAGPWLVTMAAEDFLEMIACVERVRSATPAFSNLSRLVTS